MIKVLFWLVLLSASGPAVVLAQDGANAITPITFETEIQEQRYRHFSKILRCPLCQNQNLNGSNSGVAGDLRRELHRLISEDKADSEIIDFMQSRYGDFILYDPPLNAATSALWFGPLFLLLIGLGIVIHLVRRQNATSAEPTDLALSEKSTLQAELDPQPHNDKPL